MGQLIEALQSNKYDPDNTSVLITQTGEDVELQTTLIFEKALVDAGFPQVPVLSLNPKGMDDNPGFKNYSSTAPSSFNGSYLWGIC